MILAAAAVLLGLVLAGALRPFGWNASALCDFGAEPLAHDARYQASAASTFRPGFVVMTGKNAHGYDGQYYFFVACDPFARHVQEGGGRYADPYYWQRILHPLLAWAMAGGEPARIPAAMAAVTFLSILAGTWALLALMPDAGADRWWTLAYALGVGHLYGLQLAVGGPALSLALCLGGVLAWTRGRGCLCAILLALALLARESAVLVMGPLALWSFLKGRRRDALLTSAALLPWLVWEVYLHHRFGNWGFARSGGHLTWPFLGIWQRAHMLSGSGVDFASSLRGMANNGVLLAFLGYGIWVAVDAVIAWWRNARTLPGFLYLVHAAFFCCLTPGQLVDLNGASRPFLPVLPFLVLSRSTQGGGRRLALGGGLLFSAAVALKVALAHPAFQVWRS
jgi:hypothetical protein